MNIIDGSQQPSPKNEPEMLANVVSWAKLRVEELELLQLAQFLQSHQVVGKINSKLEMWITKEGE